VSIENPRVNSSFPALSPPLTDLATPVEARAIPASPQLHPAGILPHSLGMKQVVLLVVTMVCIAIAVSATVTLYVARSVRPPAVETNQP
jgi:hypothetical protein